LNSEFYDKYSKVINKAVMPVEVNWKDRRKIYSDKKSRSAYKVI
jgi:hypothetical protein